MESKFCGFRSFLLIHILILSSSCVAEMNVSNVEQCTDTVNIPRDFYDVLTSLLHKQVKEQQQEGQIAVLEHRISTMENQLHIYEEDRQQLFQYAKVVTEALKRLMKLEEVTDSVTNGIQVMKDKTQYLENDFAELKNNVSEIEIRVKEEQISHRDLTSNISEYSMNCSSKVDSIELYMEDALNNFTSQRNPQEQQINKRLMSLEDYFTNVDREANTTMKAVASIQRDIVSLSEKVHHRKEKVAFTVRLGSHSQFASNAVIKFSRIISNIGGGYNTSDGLFYCPVDGIYMFDISLTANYYIYVDAYLVKNGNKIDYFWSKTSGNQAPTATASFALTLKTGDRVWLRCRVSDRKYDTHSYFTGFLIF